MRTRIVGAGVAAVAVLVAGCDGEDDGRAQTLPQVTTSSAADAEPTTPEPAALTKKQARAALVAVNDLPTGWSENEPDDDRKASGTVTPGRCRKMTGSAEQRETLATTSFSQGGALGSSLSQEIYRPRGADPVERLADLKAAMAECRSYSVKDSSGTSKIRISGLSFPELEDGTLAVHAVVDTPLVKATNDVVYIAVGSVIVRFDSISITSGMSGADLERVARKAVSNVRKG